MVTKSSKKEFPENWDKGPFRFFALSKRAVLNMHENMRDSRAYREIVEAFRGEVKAKAFSRTLDEARTMFAPNKVLFRANPIGGDQVRICEIVETKMQDGELYMSHITSRKTFDFTVPRSSLKS